MERIKGVAVERPIFSVVTDFIHEQHVVVNHLSTGDVNLVSVSRNKLYLMRLTLWNVKKRPIDFYGACNYSLLLFCVFGTYNTRAPPSPLVASVAPVPMSVPV